MAVNRLCAAFRQIINRQNNIIVRCSSSKMSKEQNNVLSSFNSSTIASNVVLPKVHIKFIPRTLNIDFGNPDSTSKKNINELPLSKYIPSMEEPITPKPIRQDLPLTGKSLELPTMENVLEKLAVRMLIIRRKKMKKHKRKKLRKRMKFIWAKLRANRNQMKEKVFQAELIAKIKEAQMFDAKAYVQQRLSLLDKEILPKTYRGEILHPSVIKQFLKERKEKREKWKNIPRLTLD